MLTNDQITKFISGEISIRYRVLQAPGGFVVAKFERDGSSGQWVSRFDNETKDTRRTDWMPVSKAKRFASASDMEALA